MNRLPYAASEDDTPTNGRTFRRRAPGTNLSNAAATAQTRIIRKKNSNKVSARGRQQQLEVQLGGGHGEIAEHSLEGSHVGLGRKPRRYVDCSTP